MNPYNTSSFPALTPEPLPEEYRETFFARYLPQAFQSLGHHDFCILWTGALASSTGSWMQTVAQSWLVYNLTGSSFWLGVDAFLATVPSMLLSLFTGVVADHFDRRKLLLFSQYSQMTCAFVLATLVYFQRVEVWHILVLTFLTGTAQAFGGPAHMSLLPTLVPRGLIPNAVAFNSIQFNLARVLGPAIAGFALVKFGSAMCFGLNGISFIAVVISLYSLRLKPTVNSTATLLEGLRSGLAFMKQYFLIWKICALGFSVAFLGVGTGTLLPVFAQQVFHSDAVVYSHLVSCAGLGAVTGAVLVAVTSEMQRRGRLLVAAQALSGILMVAFACSRNLWFSYVVLFFAGLCLIMSFAMLTALLQHRLPDNVRGRIISIYMLSFQAGVSLGGLTAGVAANRFSPTLTLAVEGTILATLALTMLVMRAKISKL